MSSSLLYVGSVVAVAALVIGGGIALALTFYILSVLISVETGGSFTPAPTVVSPPTDPMALSLWKREREISTAARMRRTTAYRGGVMVLLWLALLTIGEFAANLIGASTSTLFIIAIIKAAIIAQYFMHLSSLWFDGGNH